MKLSHRILAAPSVAVAFLLAVAATNQVSLRAMAQEFDTLRGDKVSTSHSLSAIETRMATMNALLYRTMALIDSDDAMLVQRARKTIEAETEAISAAIVTMGPKVSDDSRLKLMVVVENVGKYRQNAMQALALAETTPGAATAVLASAERSFGTSFGTLQTVSKSVDAEVESMSEHVVALSERAFLLSIVMTLVATTASSALAWWIARNIVRGLDIAVQVSEAVARGELDIEVPVGNDDELGRLLGSLRITVQRLGDSLREIQQTVLAIHNASSEISAGGQDLSQRTEQAAASLQQTATSVSTLTMAVDQSSTAAHEANALAVSASDLAERGGGAVSAMVGTMQGINASSKKIADITSVIDGIAFQTNILALNAAVEAARAGDQGRGFAVVATEVRNLAQRSASAARDVKALISTSVDKAAHGALLAAEAGSAMNEIVIGVRRVGDMIAGISNASGEQSSGLADVNAMVAKLDDMTQQNAALAEQSAAASASLNGLAQRLAAVVGTFRFRISSALLER